VTISISRRLSIISLLMVNVNNNILHFQLKHWPCILWTMKFR